MQYPDQRRMVRDPAGIEYAWHPIEERHHHSPFIPIVHLPLAEKGRRWRIGLGGPLYDTMLMPEMIRIDDRGERVAIVPSQTGIIGYYVYVYRNRMRYIHCDDLEGRPWLVPGDYLAEIHPAPHFPWLTIGERLPDVPGSGKHL